ncbi:MAG: AmmeMemoRadiSam system protein B [Elusimicrobia bacterium]|nr:AmmeMemoRadiSam system protein B [Elusimicrobiota bacterium]
MIRKPVAAGRFYESDAARLKDAVASYLRKVEPVKGKLLGILAPHAGYVYSGKTAGQAFSYLMDADFDTVVFFGTGHALPVKGGALLYKDAFETPLGRVEIDSIIAVKLLEQPKIFENVPEAHEREHSIEVQIPFLQVLKKNFKIVPILFNTHKLEILQEAGRAVAEAVKGKKAVICVSTDLSHYPPADVAEKADKSLMTALGIAIRNKDMSYFDTACRLILEKERYSLDTVCCGQSAVIAGVCAAIELGADDFDLIKYTHSGMVSKDDSNVVGYASGLLLKSENPLDGRIPLSVEMKKELLYYARKSIELYLKEKKIPAASLSDTVEFNQPGAVFVTLSKRGSLRGCIGTMNPKSTLLDAVRSFAVASASEDPRFPALTASELSMVSIEISILSPLRRASGHDEVKEKMHGVYIKKGYLSGTYLPQVWEHFKTKEEFLNSLCAEKAGLAGDAWKDKSTEIYVYTVDAFREE